MAEPVTVYGAQDCDDTERTRIHLQRLGIPFHEVNIDQEHDAERCVLVINAGERSTPTVVIRRGKRKIVVTEPTDDEIVQVVREAGYDVMRSRMEHAPVPERMG